MECANRDNSPSGTSNLIDLISSVNTLIDHLSDPTEDTASALIDRSSTDINRQLKQLEKIFVQQSKWKREKNRLDDCEQLALGETEDKVESYSISSWSNYTTSNCNAEGNSQRSTKRLESRRHHSALVTSSSDSDCSECSVTGKCFPCKVELQNTSNRGQMIVRRRPSPDQQGKGFSYISNGSSSDKGFDSEASVDKIERSVINLRQQVVQIKQRFDQQRECGKSECSLSGNIKSDIRRVHNRISALRKTLWLTLGGISDSRVGCRHRGSATEQDRDPLTDLKCKYERNLLCNRFDVSWPFLHIIAPRSLSWGTQVCCGHDL